jgi:endogenous inhibitor of DNA gyrase (YacG/DUF329 family)
MGIIPCIIGILVLLFFASGIIWAMNQEYKEYNNGICPKCGKPLKWFDTDSHGGRGYCCNECRYYVWVSYDWIDKEYPYLNEKKNNEKKNSINKK